MRRRPRKRQRREKAQGGQQYRHACPVTDFVTIATEIDAAGPDGISRDELHARTDIPWTRIQVALLFLNERGCINRQGRRGRLYAQASNFMFEDAMIEYHALRERGPADELLGHG